MPSSTRPSSLASRRVNSPSPRVSQDCRVFIRGRSPTCVAFWGHARGVVAELCYDVPTDAFSNPGSSGPVKLAKKDEAAKAAPKVSIPVNLDILSLLLTPQNRRLPLRLPAPRLQPPRPRLRRRRRRRRRRQRRLLLRRRRPPRRRLPAGPRRTLPSLARPLPSYVMHRRRACTDLLTDSRHLPLWRSPRSPARPSLVA